MRTFGERLKQCIADRGTTQAEVARRAGITAASISDWTADKVQTGNVKADPLLRAAAFLAVNPSWLLTGRGQPVTHSSVVLAAEPAPSYREWPLPRIDPGLIARLSATELAQLEGAWIYAARLLGFSLVKAAAA